jgi:hypothetical protein
MKKVKIMLLSLTLIAVVGGALAFKVNKFDQNYCTTVPWQEGSDKYCTYDPPIALKQQLIVALFLCVGSTAMPVENEPEVCYTLLPLFDDDCNKLCPREAEHFDVNF